MIRFTVVDRLVRLAMAALSPRECVYMMYILGIRNGIHPGGAYLVGGNEIEIENDLRTRDAAMGVQEGVFELPDSERQVQAPRGRGDVMGLLNTGAVGTIICLGVPHEDRAHVRWTNEYGPLYRDATADNSRGQTNDPYEQPVVQEVTGSSTVFTAPTPQDVWMEEDAHLHLAELDARREVIQGRTRIVAVDVEAPGANMSTEQVNVAYRVLDTDCDNRRR